jgi:hypothetical protein
MTILEHFGEPGSFIPTNVDEYFDLQLAKRFDDVENAHRYAAYSRRFSQEQLLGVYQEALGGSRSQAAARFHSSFTQLEP